MDDERREMDPPPPAAPRRAAAASGTPTASRGSSTASSSSSNSHPPAPASTGTPPAAIVPWAAARVGDSCYYPGCRKDANCACEICLASIDATRDLVRAPEAASARRFFAGAAAAKDRRPALFCRGRGAGEGSDLCEPPWTPPMRSTAKSRRAAGQAAAGAREATGARGSHDWALYAATVLGFLLLLWVDTGLVPEAVARGFGPKLSPEAMARVGADARLASGGALEHKLRVLEHRVAQLGGGERTANCSSHDSVWRLHQNDQHVFHWRCTMYKSVAEEVSIWGSALRASGLLPAALSARHLILLSGEITEWSDGRVWPMVRASNGSSWSYRRHRAVAVRLEPETWVLEYQRSALFEGTRLIPAAAELLASRCSTMARRARRRLKAKRRIFGGAQANPT